MPFQGFDTFVWPIPMFNGRKPVISDPFSATKTAKHRKHLGVDLMYLWQEGDPKKLPNTSPGGMFYMPDDVPVLAAGPGEVWSIKKLDNGWAVMVDHGFPYTTLYLHMESVTGTLKAHSKGSKGTIVKPGDPLGVVGKNPSERRALKHLHFEVLQWGQEKQVVHLNPEGSGMLHSWPFFGTDEDLNIVLVQPTEEDTAKEKPQVPTPIIPPPPIPGKPPPSRGNGLGIGIILIPLGLGGILLAAGKKKRRR